MKNRINIYIDQFISLWKSMRGGKLHLGYQPEDTIYIFPFLGFFLGMINVLIVWGLQIILEGSAFKFILVAACCVILGQHFLEKGKIFSALKKIANFLVNQKSIDEYTKNYTIIFYLIFIFSQLLFFVLSIKIGNLWLLLLVPSLSYLSLANIYLLDDLDKRSEKMKYIWLLFGFFFLFFSVKSIIVFFIAWFSVKVLHTKIQKIDFSNDEGRQILDVTVTLLIYISSLLVYG